ncbi:deoxyribodipyrimidine photo-lyase [Rhodocytophaga aerolata]|uniref:Deoxyribodipyrimidine photo-lyase n=1 Tax=Rhodocytophaga aerolata TaxID=455078 RepID=A0ABT8RAW4_9BACT|nr:deoxyribodipyrimidine photo-lyase [Rhodocytophaga aerolata]MDO1448826.1 deoxyribodipyrimidine photo-lyase [Rhodocytophaga aerolata]
MHSNKQPVAIFWFRRDLRIHDNTAFYRALTSGLPVLPLFIFDKDILDRLEDRDDARVTFIHDTILALQDTFAAQGSDLLVQYGKPIDIFRQLLFEYNIPAVYINHDYEPYATRRDAEVKALLAESGTAFHTFKDQVLFEYREIVNGQGQPYKVFTPYSKKWLTTLSEEHIKEQPSQKHLYGLYKTKTEPVPSLQEMGFIRSSIEIPASKIHQDVLEKYAKERDYPAREAATRIGIHLRFGTISIRETVKKAQQHSAIWLNELIWRDFYSMLLANHPQLEHSACKPGYDRIEWRNNEQEFERWCQGKTGYPIVDAGMRQLNQTGYMHNRVRMIAASFLVKHLLIDWRWGDAYFARKLLDYEMASNNGSWQWIAGSGCDAAPYFRVFNPNAQAAKFDKAQEYVRKWVPELGTATYPKPMVEHEFARDRMLKVYKAALTKQEMV